MFVRFNATTGALIAEGLTEEPTPGEGEAVAPMPPSAVAGLTVWDPATRGYIDPPPPPSRLDALITLLVAKGTITAAEAAGLPN